MREHLRVLTETPGYDPVSARNRVREYLQISILGSLQTAGAMLSLAFLGGTALRVLYRLPRFSEDLDFSLVRSKDYDFRRYLEATLADLQRQGYAVEIARQRDGKAVHSAFVRFPELLADLGLARRGSKPLAIKLEVDTNPPAGADQPPVISLLGSRVAKAWKPLDRHCEGAAVLKMDDEGVRDELHSAGPCFGRANDRSIHSIAPQRQLGARSSALGSGHDPILATRREYALRQRSRSQEPALAGRSS